MKGHAWMDQADCECLAKVLCISSDHFEQLLTEENHSPVCICQVQISISKKINSGKIAVCIWTREQTIMSPPCVT